MSKVRIKYYLIMFLTDSCNSEMIRTEAGSEIIVSGSAPIVQPSIIYFSSDSY